jgi:hypothetical protein
MVRLVAGNEWCRLVDDDVYRLHATAIGDGATTLRWSGIYLPPSFTISLHAQCAIAESKAVVALLTVTGADGQSVQQSSVLCSGRPVAIVVEGVSGNTVPSTISLEIEPLEKLSGGERVVIDVQPVICTPRAIQTRIAA